MTVLTEQQKTSNPRASLSLVAQLVRFVAIGGFCALIDFGIYQGLRALGWHTTGWEDLARAISFIVGTTTAYFLNRHFTFAHGQRKGAGQIGGFIALYTVTFFVAVGVNWWMLLVIEPSSWQSTIAWVISQGSATVINFVMLRWVVFREQPATEAVTS